MLAFFKDDINETQAGVDEVVAAASWGLLSRARWCGTPNFD